MTLIELKIKHYERLYVSGIKELTYRPKKPLQVLLASNGSGKSSLLKEVIANADNLNVDYGEGGYRVATYLHNSCRYSLGYNRDDNRHSFIKDDEELNNGGLKKIQTTLIEEHFGLTKPIHEMLLSVNTFTNMSISERKNWFTNILTDIDYTDALSLYGRAKLKVKDLTSYIKLTQSKLIKDEEAYRSMTPEIMKELENDKQTFNIIIDNLLSKKYNNVDVKRPNIDELKVNIKSINNMLSNVVTSKTDLVDDITKLNTELEVIKHNLNRVNKEFDDLDGNIDISGNTDIKDLTNRLTSIDNELKVVVEYYNGMGIQDVILMSNLFIKHHDRLLEVIHDLYEYRDAIYAPNDISSMIDSLTYKKSNIDKLNSDIVKLEVQYSSQVEMSKQDNVTCPKCSTDFKPNYDAILLDGLKVTLIQKRTERDKLSKDIQKLETSIANSNTRVSLTKDLRILFKTISDTFIYEYMVKETNNFTNIDNLSTLVSRQYNRIPDIDHLVRVIAERDEVSNGIRLINELSSDKYKHIVETKNRLAKERIGYITKLNDINNIITKRKRSLANINKINDLSKIVEHQYSDIMKYKEDMCKVEYNRLLNALITEAKREVTIIETRLIEHERISKHYDELKQDLDKFKIDLHHAKLLTNLLSPSKGIIGESMSAPINAVLAEMNHIVNKVWTYDIEILPCTMEDGGLTFRFPVILGGVKTIPDISKGSSSIKDIIDAAFKITAMRFLKMLDYPLILDEFGNTMDEVHRIKVYDYIEELGKENFSQIYMVAHFESLYSRFNNTDVVVLNNDNVNYTGTHNEVMKLK